MGPQDGDSLELHTTSNSIKKLLTEKEYNLETKDSLGNTALHAQVTDVHGLMARNCFTNPTLEMYSLKQTLPCV